MKTNRRFYELLSILIFSCLLNCSTKEKNQEPLADDTSSLKKIEKTDSYKPKEVQYKSEKWITDTILSIEEVKKEDKFLQKKTKGERKLSVEIYSFPNKTDKYYWVKVWEDNGFAYATHFNFYVYPETKKIMFYDTLNDTLIDLQTWKESYEYFNFK
jgi:hypothetical protein